MEKILKRLGMTNNEVEVYLSLLKSSELSVNDVAFRSGLHRQVCYDALDRLAEKGFVSSIKKDNKKFFMALNPKKILDYLENEKEEVLSILPKLQSMIPKQNDEANVELLKGKLVLRTIYNDIFGEIRKGKQPLYAMGIDEEKFIEYDEIAIRQHILRMKENGLKEYLLSRTSATYFFEGRQSEYRLLPDALFNPNPTHVYGDKIAIIIWGNPVYGIIITNRQIADANRKYFKLLWKNAKTR